MMGASLAVSVSAADVGSPETIGTAATHDSVITIKE